MSRLVTDDMIEVAIQYLATASQMTAAARANRIRAEHKRKRTRAMLILQSEERSATMREAWAEAHDLYAEACEAEALAAETDEFHRNERNKADSIIEAWRTESASQRAGSNFR